MTIKDKHLSLLCFLLCFIIYYLCLPSVVTLEDSGLFNLVCASAGIGHPPGYPLYSLLCVPFAHLPFISTPLGLNIFSALTGAGCCAVLYLILIQLSLDKTSALLGGFALAFSKAFWSQSIIQEVYTLNLLLSLSSFLFMLRFRQTLQLKDWLLTIVLFTLGVCTHWPLTMLFAPTLAIVFIGTMVAKWEAFKNWLSYKIVFLSIAVMLLSLLPYLYLWLRSLQFENINFYGALDNWKRFLIYISRSGYAGVDSSGGAQHKIYYLWWLLDQAKQQLTIIGFGIALIGISGSIVTCYRNRSFDILLALFWALLSTTVVLTFILNFSFEPTFQAVFSVYPLLSWSIAAIFFAFGVSYLIHLAVNIEWLHQLVKYGSAGVVVYMLFQHYPLNDRSKDRLAHEAALHILNQLEPNADLFVFDDTHLPIIYLHYVENVRPDVRVYNTQSLILGNRLFDIDTPIQYRPAIFANHIVQSGRPTYYFQALNTPFGYEDNGIFRKVRTDLPKNSNEWVDAPELWEFFNKLYKQYSHLPFNNYWNNSFIETFISGHLFHKANTQTLNQQQAQNFISMVLNNNPDSYHANHLLGVLRITQSRWNDAIEPLKKSVEVQPRLIDPLSNLINTLIHQGRREEAIEYLINHNKRWPSKRNETMIEEARAGKFVNQG